MVAKFRSTQGEPTRTVGLRLSRATRARLIVARQLLTVLGTRHPTLDVAIRRAMANYINVLARTAKRRGVEYRHALTVWPGPARRPRVVVDYDELARRSKTGGSVYE